MMGGTKHSKIQRRLERRIKKWQTDRPTNHRDSDEQRKPGSNKK